VRPEQAVTAYRIAIELSCDRRDAVGIFPAL
jgi:hypothetical protein